MECTAEQISNAASSSKKTVTTSTGRKRPAKVSSSWVWLLRFPWLDKRAFRLVESNSFALFCKKLNMHYNLPSRATLGCTIEGHCVDAGRMDVASIARVLYCHPPLD